MIALRTVRDEVVAALRTRDHSRLVFVFVGVVYVARVIAAGWRTGFPMFFPDSSSYVAVSRMGPFDPSFWFADRPVGVPFLLWMVGGNHRVFFLAQTLLFAVSLAVLCSVLMRVITPRWVAWIAVGAVTSISVHPRFGLWHLEILSESLALSLSLLLVALWLSFAHDQNRRHLVLAVLTTVAWMSVRDVHIVFGIVIALALAVRAAAGRHWPLRKVALVGSGLLVVVSAYVLVAQGTSDRNLYPLINNIGERVLTDPELTSTFEGRGMPIDDALRDRTGADTWSDDQRFLLSSDLAEFRSWADSHGQRALVSSLMVDPTFWVDATRSAVDTTLPQNFSEYDRHGTSDRLPTRLLWFHGPRTSTQLFVWFGVALASVGSLFAISRRRQLATAGSIAIIGSLADLYLSASGDSVEVQRHVLGPIFRLTLLLVILIALGAGEVLGRVRFGTRFGSRMLVYARPSMSLSASLAVALGVLGIFGSWVALEHRSQDYDPQFARTIVERAARFNGTYYENGIHNKGPLETAIYDSARIFTRYDTYWFAISAYVVVISILLGLTAWMIARHASTRDARAPGILAVTAGALVAFHFALSDSDYAGVLYSRNITTAILAAVVAATIWHAPWRTSKHSTASYLVLFALLGLAVQTLLTTAFAAAVVGCFVYLRRSSATGLRHPLAASLGMVATTVATAPAWYALRGSFAEFWSSWWTYAGYMSSSTGRSLLNQIGLGAQKMFGYYQERPAVAFIVIAYIVLLRLCWRTMSTWVRTMHLMLMAWLAAGWVELVLSQRYSSHYFSVVAVPTAFIAAAAAVLLSDILRDYRAQRVAATPRVPVAWWQAIAAVCVLLSVQGTQLAWIAVEGAGGFRSTDHYVQARADMRSGAQETRQAVLDLVTEDDDPLLAWTMYPWTYLDNRRVPATRFSWKSFLIGEIYLGRTSPRYVLDRTWEWFAEDLAQSNPRIYARPQVTALEPPTPFSKVVEDEFTIVYADDEIELGWRRDLWDVVTAIRSQVMPTPDKVDLTALPSGWTVDSATDRITAESGVAAWATGIRPCSVVSTRIIRESSADPMGLVFEFASPDPAARTVSLSVDFDRSWSMREDEIGIASPTELHATVLPESRRTTLDIELLVTTRSAALVVGNRIVAAIDLPDATSINLLPTVDSLMIEMPTVGPLRNFTGC